ncbi:RsmD family RNA methyltransferase [Phycisphaera mikurensis]|uniref:Putative RNA methyltransferase n=1 Tax=Phycisphaera mikurensis (strain NBRC 102666 / KCTC 22515 / FYK2301M01) TaxID=1142394 RepID=I0ICA0_PHYMF|nr:RsmD family RNA methyltransferase [Phycisphaera mikurensis]MBB6441893.1 16S rRNA (guanine(966)-N(2))-methyltransferase RsmD [Phycisphaera mikurensis]BAM02888.1 putative RNA methyltransferase [Phycisphaera mikurensis NBRC 102666]
MRIIAGTHKRRPLEGPEDERTTRPITDRVKEAMFNRLTTMGVVGWGQALDVFCGTGSIGLEALSRGAERCTFVDRDADAIARLKRNVATLREQKRAHVIAAAALPPFWAHALPDAGLALVTLDPPYPLVRPPREVDSAAETAAAEAAIEAAEFEALEAAVAAAEAEEVLASLGRSSGVVDAIGRERYGGVADAPREPGPRKRKNKNNRKPPARASRPTREPRQEPDPTPELLAALTPKLDEDGILVLRTPAGVQPPLHAGLAEPESHRYGGMVLHFYAVDPAARAAGALARGSADRG